MSVGCGYVELYNIQPLIGWSAIVIPVSRAANHKYNLMVSRFAEAIRLSFYLWLLVVFQKPGVVKILNSILITVNVFVCFI